MDLQPYSDFRPTALDPAGAFLDEPENRWFVAPVSQTRDSGLLEKSNFDCYVKALGGESETVQIHRFGHWGPGWFELALIMPCSVAHSRAIELNQALENYPVVDESDYLEREYNATLENIEHIISLAFEHDPGWDAGEVFSFMWNSGFEGDLESADGDAPWPEEVMPEVLALMAASFCNVDGDS